MEVGAPPRAGETAALVPDSARASRDDARVPSGGSRVFLTLASLAALAFLAHACSPGGFAVAALGDRAERIARRRAANVAAESRCEHRAPRGADAAACVKYVADDRRCASVDDFREGSCLRVTEGASFFERGEAKIGASRPYEEWLPKYYACVNGAADDVERPYRVPARGRAKPAFEKARRDRLAAVAGEKGAAAVRAKPLTREDAARAANVAGLGEAHRDALAADSSDAEHSGATTVRSGSGFGSNSGSGSVSGSSSGSSSSSSSSPSAYAWAFVHIPKAGGSYFTELLRAHLWTLRQRHGENARHSFYSDALYAPVMDLTEPHFRDVTRRYFHGDPGPQAGPAGMAAAHAEGHREVFKGALAMGVCDVVHAPCAYLTVLRDPLERLMSQYAYSCLEGSEDRAGWTAEMRANGRCDLSPSRYFETRGGAELGVQLLAPRANPSSRCALEAAKANLASGCVRYLLLENLEDGIEKLRTKQAADFAGFGSEPSGFEQADPTVRWTKNGSGGARLGEANAKKLERYRADAEEMDRLRTIAAHEIELYEFAKENYERNWARDLVTC